MATPAELQEARERVLPARPPQDAQGVGRRTALPDGQVYDDLGRARAIVLVRPEVRERLGQLLFTPIGHAVGYSDFVNRAIEAALEGKWDPREPIGAADRSMPALEALAAVPPGAAFEIFVPGAPGSTMPDMTPGPFDRPGSPEVGEAYLRPAGHAYCLACGADWPECECDEPVWSATAGSSRGQG